MTFFLILFPKDIILEHLASQKPKMKSDGINVAGWFQSLTLFCGAISKRYPQSIELESLLYYIRHQLQDLNSFDLLLLKELLSQMAGIDVFEDLTENEIEGQCGGPFLRAETIPIKPPKGIKRATTKLKETLIKTNLLFPILMGVAQQRTVILFKTETQHLKLIGDLYDKVNCHGHFLHLFLE